MINAGNAIGATFNAAGKYSLAQVLLRRNQQTQEGQVDANQPRFGKQWFSRYKSDEALKSNNDLRRRFEEIWCS